MIWTLDTPKCLKYSVNVHETLAATLPGYGSIPFILDEDFNIAQGLIRMVGVGKIVRCDRVEPLPPDVIM